MKILGRVGLIGALGIAFAACDSRGEIPMQDTDAEMPAGQQMEGMGETGMMQRHAEELDEMTDRMGRHVQQMRQRSPEDQHESMREHVAQVSEMLALMNRQMREMDMGMGMSDEQMGQMMGITGAEHRRVKNEMEALRTDLEQLQTASSVEIRQRMSAHLDRLDRLQQMLEESADAMRQM